MVSVSSAVPKLRDGNIDIAQWSQRLVQGHARLQHEPLEEAATWLSGFGDSLLLQSLELAEMVAELRLDQAAVLAAMTYPGLRRVCLMRMAYSGVLGIRRQGSASAWQHSPLRAC